MSDSYLRDALRQLLPEEPSSGFERRVTGAIRRAAAGTGTSRRGHRRRVRLAALPAALLLFALAVGGATATVVGIAHHHAGAQPGDTGPARPGAAAVGGGATTPSGAPSPGRASASNLGVTGAGPVARGSAASPATAGAQTAPGGDGGGAMPTPGAYPEVQACPSDNGGTFTIHQGQRLLVFMYCTPTDARTVWSNPTADDSGVLTTKPDDACASPSCTLFFGGAVGTAHVTAYPLCGTGVCPAPQGYRITVHVIA